MKLSKEMLITFNEWLLISNKSYILASCFMCSPQAFSQTLGENYSNSKTDLSFYSEF